jgi:integrase
MIDMTGLLTHEFIDHLVISGHSDRTIETYLRWLRRYDRELGLACEDPRSVRHWLAHPDWSPGTRKGARTALRAWYRWAQAEGVVSSDPTDRLPAIKVRRGMPKPAPDDVWASAWRAAQTWQERAMLLLACHAGLRRAEIASFHRDWIEGDVIRVQGKGGKVRLVPMSDELQSHLALWPMGAHTYLCPGRWGGHVEASYVGKRLSRLLGPGWSGHALRHRAATMAYEASCDLGAVQEMLGHDSPETTRIYTRVSVDHVRAAVRAGAKRSPTRPRLRAA